MKKRVSTLFMLVVCALAACTHQSSTPTQGFSPLGDKIKFCESVLTHGDTVLVASFGSKELNPLNNEQKGYILIFKDTLSQIFIPAKGYLSAPKGMLIVNDHLFVADVGKMMVFNLSDTSAAPQTVTFPEGELFINDLALEPSTQTLYITVTNTGNIYSLNVSDPALASETPLCFYTNVPGANGIVIDSNAMWIASYPADGVTTPDNVIYHIPSIASPQIIPVFDRPGQYDGLALSPDKTTLYFTNWTGPEVGCVNLNSGKVSILPVTDSLTGPARIQLQDNILYIPDLPGSQVIRYQLP